MKFIAHIGNVNGSNINKENKLAYLLNTIKQR